MTAKIGVVTFPGSLDDSDALRAVRLSGAEPVSLWHADHTLAGVDAVILPGGFSYGDYLRCGAISRFAPVRRSGTAADVGLRCRICHGFRSSAIRTAAGALVRTTPHFFCRTRLRVDSSTQW